jgi:peptidoglycan/LPS O-acetylase OafA/YrhL
MVIYFHLHGFLAYHLTSYKAGVPAWLSSIFNNGDNGVPIFFALSGFILGIPFAKAAKIKHKKIDIGRFFLRRLTRLQPTYLIALTGMGILYVMMGHYSISAILPNYLSSIFYTHNIIYGTGSIINYVAWSLEIEIQFYLLLPLLGHFFKIPRNFRMFLLVILIGTAPWVQSFIPFGRLTFIHYYEFFLVGFLLIDALELVSNEMMNLKNGFELVIGLVLLYLLMRLSLHNNVSAVVYPFLVLALFVVVLKGNLWKHFFGQRYISGTGTFSYSIYLIHFQIIAVTGAFILNIGSSMAVLPKILLIAGISLPLVWVLSAIFFLLFEKPFMNPVWYKEIRLNKKKNTNAR